MAFPDAPTPGSRWLRTDDPAVHWTVVFATTSGARLVADDGRRMDVYPNQWPAGWTLVPGEAKGDEPPPPVIALLVGGAGGKHVLRLIRLAAERGVEIRFHEEYKKRERVDHINREVTLVLFLASHMSHSLYESAKATAQRSGLPFVHVTSENFGPSLEGEMRRLGIPIRAGSEAVGAAGTGVVIDVPGWWTHEADGHWRWVDAKGVEGEPGRRASRGWAEDATQPLSASGAGDGGALGLALGTLFVVAVAAHAAAG